MLDFSQSLERLGLGTADDPKAVRRAYARELKAIDQEADPTAFQLLREAYEQLIGEPGRAGEAADSALSAPEAEAKEAYDWLVAAVAVISAGRRVADETMWVADLREQLAEQQPATIDGGRHLERAIARLLSQGWKPGHEALLIAATQHFGWEEQGNWPSIHLAEAWFERMLLHHQRVTVRGPILRVVRDLRQLHDPDLGCLRRDHGYLVHFSNYYCNLAPVIVDPARLLRWHELAKPFGEAPDVSWAEPEDEEDQSVLLDVARAIVILIIVMLWFILSSLGRNNHA